MSRATWLGQAVLCLALLIATGPVRAAPQLVVRCEPAVVVRGEKVICSAHLDPPLSGFLIGRLAEAKGHVHREALREPHAPSDVLLWQGPAVVSTQVTFTVSTGNEKVEGAGRFEVQPRRFPRLALTAQNHSCKLDAAAKTLTDPPALAKGSRPDEPLPAEGAFALARLSFPPPEWELVSEGPNQDWYFVKSLGQEPPTLRTLLTRALEPDVPFRLAQFGDRSLPSKESGAWPHCRKVDLARLHDELWAGEGCAEGSDASRLQRIAHVLATQVDVNAQLENLTAPLSKGARENPFTPVLDRLLRALEKQVLESPAALPAPIKLGCRLRYP